MSHRTGFHWIKLVALVVSLLTARSAFAQPQLDQFFEPAPGQGGAQTNLPVAQVFTVGISGRLTKVELLLSLSPGLVPAPLTVEIRTTVNGFPSAAAPLASFMFAPTSLPASPAFVPIALPNPVNVNQGDVLAIVTIPTGVAPLWTAGSAAGGYPGGDASFEFSPGTWSPFVVFPIDFGFRTYVDKQVSCDLQLSQDVYMNGNVVTVPVFRFTNPTSAPVATEVKAWLGGPGGTLLSIINAGANGLVTLPAGLNTNLGPFNLFQVSPAIPRGTYEFGCRILNPITGAALSASVKSFVVQ